MRERESAMDKSERNAEVTRLKREASQAKSRLMELSNTIALLSRAEAAKLNAIVGRLESWQNNGRG
jgi:hypothetical protein